MRRTARACFGVSRVLSGPKTGVGCSVIAAALGSLDRCVSAHPGRPAVPEPSPMHHGFPSRREDGGSRRPCNQSGWDRPPSQHPRQARRTPPASLRWLRRSLSTCSAGLPSTACSPNLPASCNGPETGSRHSRFGQGDAAASRIERFTGNQAEDKEESPVVFTMVYLLPLKRPTCVNAAMQCSPSAYRAHR